MRKLPSTIADDMNDSWTYELPGGRRIGLDRRAVRQFGAAELIREYGINPFAPGEEGQRLPVYQGERKIGSLPAAFDPEVAKSGSALFDIRPGDFRREADRWIACRSLGPGDIGALSEFRPDGDARHYEPTPLRFEEEEVFAHDGPAAGMKAFLGRLLGEP